jgi:hypothetical protein
LFCEANGTSWAKHGTPYQWHDAGPWLRLRQHLAALPDARWKRCVAVGDELRGQGFLRGPRDPDRGRRFRRSAAGGSRQPRALCTTPALAITPISRG